MSFLSLIIITLFTTTFAAPASKTTTATPDESSPVLSIKLNNDYVTIQDNTWKIWTPERQSYEDDAPYADESDEYKVSQTGMNMQITVGEQYSFSKNQISTITITIDGTYQDEHTIQGETISEGDMILAFSNTSSTQYFSSMIRLDNNCDGNACSGIIVYPQCENKFAEGNVETIADGSDFRFWTVMCPNDHDECEELPAIKNSFPITIQIKNDPRNGMSKYKYINNDESSVSCKYNTAFEVDNGFKFYIAGEGINAPEILYISSISVSKDYCDKRPEWSSRFVNSGRFTITDPCYEETNFEFIFDSMTQYLSTADSEGQTTLFVNTNGNWMNSGIYDGIDSYEQINARINKYTSDKFECEMIIFMGEGKINAQDVVQGTVKFTMRIDNIFTDENNDATLKICVNIKANGVVEETTADWEDGMSFTLANGVFKLQNEKNAKCISNEDETVSTTISVSAQKNGNVLCYIFSKCDGVTMYDPFVYYEGEEEPADDSVISKYYLSSMLIVLFVLVTVYM